jgi:hypothetical protein
MKAISALLLASALLTAPALANAQTHFQLLDTSFQGACGSVDPIINTQSGNPSIDLIFPDLSVQTDDVTPQARKLCNVRVHVKIDPGYRLSLQEVFYQGAVDIDDAGGSGNVSARAFFQGLPGINAFQRFSAGEARNFQVDVNQGTPGTICGGETYMNLLVDITARNQPHNGQFSQVAIQRGVGTPGAQGRSVIRCYVRPDPCRR